MIGMKLVTHQTGPRAASSRRVLVERGSADDARAVSRARARPRQRAPGHDGQPDGGMEIEKVAEETPERDPRRPTSTRASASAAFQARQLGVRASASTAPQVGQGGQADDGALRRLLADRRLAGRDQPAGRHRGRRPAGARRQDELRRQRALPPSGHQGAARPRRRGSARDRGLEVLAQLHQARRQHRLHGQRRRPGDGDDGHHQARRRRAGELPRRRRRRQRRADQERLPDPDVGQERQGRAHQHLRRHPALRRARRRASSPRSRSSACRCPIVIRMEGTNVEKGKRDARRERPELHHRRHHGRGGRERSSQLAG